MIDGECKYYGLAWFEDPTNHIMDIQLRARIRNWLFKIESKAFNQGSIRNEMIFQFITRIKIHENLVKDIGLCLFILVNNIIQNYVRFDEYFGIVYLNSTFLFKNYPLFIKLRVIKILSCYISCKEFIDNKVVEKCYNDIISHDYTKRKAFLLSKSIIIPSFKSELCLMFIRSPLLEAEYKKENFFLNLKNESFSFIFDDRYYIEINPLDKFGSFLDFLEFGLMAKSAKLLVKPFFLQDYKNLKALNIDNKDIDKFLKLFFIPTSRNSLITIVLSLILDNGENIFVLVSAPSLNFNILDSYFDVSCKPLCRVYI